MTIHTCTNSTHIKDMHDILTHALTKEVQAGEQWLGFMYGIGFKRTQGTVYVDCVTLIDYSVRFPPHRTSLYLCWQGGDLFFPYWGIGINQDWNQWVREESAVALRELLEGQP